MYKLRTSYAQVGIYQKESYARKLLINWHNKRKLKDVIPLQIEYKERFPVTFLIQIFV